MLKRIEKLEQVIAKENFLKKQFIYADLKNYTLTIKNKFGKIVKFYTCSEAPTVKSFHVSNLYHRLIMGPRGSSKSSGCCAEILFKAISIPPCIDGIKRSRWLVGRNTYGQLWETTIKTFQDWYGHKELSWKINKKSPINASLEFFDGECINRIELLFISFDHQDDSSTTLSLELTGAYFNEAAEIPRRVLHDITGSVGRYPSKSMFPEGVSFWSGIIYDTNAFPEYHYFYNEFVKAKDIYHQFFQQPGAVYLETGEWAVNPRAENLKNLPDDYYIKAVAGLPPNFVRSRFGNEFVSYEDGKPCHPEYDGKFNSLLDIEINPAYPIMLGHDYGGTNATVVFQYIDKQLIAVKELLGYREGLREFQSNVVGDYLARHCSTCVVEMSIGDPADNYSHETAQKSSQIVTEALKIRTHTAITNNIQARLDAVDLLITGQLANSRRRLVVSQKGCPVLHAGLSGRYQFETMKLKDDTAIKPKPCKDQYSHPCDCLQYVALHIQRLDRTEKYHEDQKRAPVSVAANVPRPVFTPYSRVNK